jgi:hypothetical protein
LRQNVAWQGKRPTVHEDEQRRRFAGSAWPQRFGSIPREAKPAQSNPLNYAVFAADYAVFKALFTIAQTK